MSNIANVARVIDGDTFEVQGNWTIERSQKDGKKYQGSRVRIQNFNAPESGSRAGQLAKQKLERLIGGKQVRLVEAAVDVYGRLVAKVIVDGVDVGTRL